MNTNETLQKKRRLIVLGAGESGVGAAVLGARKGYEVFVSDSGAIQEKYAGRLRAEGIAFEQQGHQLSNLLDANLVIKSPGIPPDAPVVLALKERGIPFLSEIEFAARYTQAKLIGITGSNGKTTTSSLCGFILKNAGLKVGLAGNIGESFALQVAEQDAEYYVLELSSFMLDDTVDLRLDVAVLLNITPDHLDRYHNHMAEYVDSKFRIIANQRPEDVFIYCADDAEIAQGLKRHKPVARTYRFSQQLLGIEGAYKNETNELIIQLQDKIAFNMSIKDLSLQGKHNVYNSMASGIVAKVLELRNDSIRESMGEFRNIPHRLERVATIGGIHFINDSKATNVNSVWYGLESIAPGIILILGGVDKGNDYQMLKELVKEKVRAIVCIGKDTQRIHQAFEGVTEQIQDAKSMQEAVQLSYRFARKGDTVLLSPACASFDWFKNYEDRGDQFKAAVKEL